MSQDSAGGGRGVGAAEGLWYNVSMLAGITVPEKSDCSVTKAELEPD